MSPKPKPVGYPQNPQNIGEHIRKERLEKGMLQKEVANIIGVNVATIEGWEGNRNKPSLKYLPKIIDFLEYTPKEFMDVPQLSNPIFLYRVKKRLTKREFAKQLEIDVTTVIAIEKGRGMIQRTQEKLLAHNITV